MAQIVHRRDGGLLKLAVRGGDLQGLNLWMKSFATCWEERGGVPFDSPQRPAGWFIQSLAAWASATAWSSLIFEFTRR